MLSSRRFVSFLMVSLLLHLSFLAVSYLSKQLQSPNPKAITIEFVDSLPPAPTRGVPKKKIQTLTTQIVEQDQKKPSEEVPETRFLSQQNQKVEKQTVAKNRGEFKNSKLDSPSLKNDSTPKKLNLAQMTPKLGKFKAYDPEAAKEETEKSDDTQKPDPSSGSATSDYIQGVDQGLETLLNAREFKYYTYYNRIRRQLTTHWEPRVRVKLSQMFKQGRYLASATDRITKLVVVLDHKGNLVKVQMMKDSGVTDLDDAAIEAFQSAAPFPNPPQGIIDPDGTVKIRWDFVLES